MKDQNSPIAQASVHAASDAKLLLLPRQPEYMNFSQIWVCALNLYFSISVAHVAGFHIREHTLFDTGSVKLFENFGDHFAYKTPSQRKKLDEGFFLLKR